MHFTLVTLCFAALFGTSICGITPTNIRDNWNVVMQCRNKTGFTAEEVANLLKLRLPTTKKAACFLACWQKKLKIRNADNTINMDKLEDMTLPIMSYNKFFYKQIMKVYSNCAKEESPKNDECTAARKYSECAIPKLRTLRRPTITVDTYLGCVNKSKISAVDLVHVILRNIPTKREAGCMIGCVEKAFGILDANNKINMTQVSKRFMLAPQFIFNKYIKIYENCQATEADKMDECAAGQKYAKCLFENEKLNVTMLVQ